MSNTTIDYGLENNLEIGCVFFLPQDWQLSFGAQLPSLTSNHDYGAVFEITNL